MGKLNNQNYIFKPRSGLLADLDTTPTKNAAVEGELVYTSDSKQLHVFTGTEFDAINKFTEYIYDSSATQSGNTFDNWPDLYAEIRKNNAGAICRVTINQNETIPAGAYIFDGIRFRGNGVAVILGGLLLTLANGVTISSWNNAVLEGGIGLVHAGAAHVMTITSSFTMQVNEGAGIAALGATSSMFNVDSGGFLILAFTGGSILIGSAFGGYEPVDIDSGGTAVIVLSGSGTNIDNDIARGAGLLNLVLGDSSPALDVYSITNANHSGTVDIDQYADARHIKGAYYTKVRTQNANAAPTYNINENDELETSGLTAAINFATNRTGTPFDGQRFVHRIKDDGTTRNITWPADYADLYATLPTATTAGKWHEVEVRYYETDSKFYCISALVQP